MEPILKPNVKTFNQKGLTQQGLNNTLPLNRLRSFSISEFSTTGQQTHSNHNLLGAASNKVGNNIDKEIPWRIQDKRKRMLDSSEHIFKACTQAD